MECCIPPLMEFRRFWLHTVHIFSPSVQVSGDATYCTLDEICQTLQEGGDQSHPVAADVGSVLIGKPLPGVYISIVNPDLLPVPANQPGELLVGGVGIALGYHRRPEETAERFLRSVAQGARQEESMVHIPGLEPGRRVFRTRDRVVQPVAGGALFWLGKLDGEVCNVGCTKNRLLARTLDASAPFP